MYKAFKGTVVLFAVFHHRFRDVNIVLVVKRQSVKKTRSLQKGFRNKPFL